MIEADADPPEVGRSGNQRRKRRCFEDLPADAGGFDDERQNDTTAGGKPIGEHRIERKKREPFGSPLFSYVDCPALLDQAALFRAHGDLAGLEVSQNGGDLLRHVGGEVRVGRGDADAIFLRVEN